MKKFQFQTPKASGFPMKIWGSLVASWQGGWRLHIEPCGKQLTNLAGRITDAYAGGTLLPSPRLPFSGSHLLLQGPWVLCPLPSLNTSCGPCQFCGCPHRMSPPPLSGQTRYGPPAHQDTPRVPPSSHLELSARPSKFRAKPNHLCLAAFSLHPLAAPYF